MSDTFITIFLVNMLYEVEFLSILLARKDFLYFKKNDCLFFRKLFEILSIGVVLYNDRFSHVTLCFFPRLSQYVYDTHTYTQSWIRIDEILKNFCTPIFKN